MHLPGGPAFLGAIPIENPISGVAVFLDLYQDISGPERVHPPARQKDRVARLHFHRMQMLLHSSLLERLLESIARRSLFYSRIKSRFRSRVRDVPKLRLRFAAKFWRDLTRWMNLERQILLSVQQLGQDWKTGTASPARTVRHVAENLVSIFAPELVQSFPAHRSFMDD